MGGVIIKAIVIDADYTYNRNGNPVIRLYSKKVGGSEDGKDICIHVKGFEPYFYANAYIEKEIDEIKDALKGHLERVELVDRYFPVGYQAEKSKLAKVILKNPRVTPECRKVLENMGYECFEADILFRNRFLIDAGIVGMGVIEFNHVGKELRGYGLACESYIVGKDEINVLDEKVSIEY